MGWKSTNHCLLFIADLNDELPPNINLQKYADDILAYIIGKLIPNDLPQAIADAISRWCTKNKMRLNIDKCKTMVISNNAKESHPIVTLNGSPLESVSSNKYLGVELNSALDWNKQWERVQKTTSSTPYLIGRLKRCGFRTELLVNAYRSFGLSHFIYSAPLLSATSAKAKDEMHRYHQRMLGIIGITAELASTKYNLVEIEKIIDNTCVSLLKRIIDDESHPLTSKLNRVSNKSKSICRITNNKIRTKASENSFVQKYLRTLRNGSSDLYTTRSNPIIKAARRPPKTLDSLPDAKAVKTTVTCPTCGKLCKSGAGIKAHIRLSHTNSS